MIVGSKSDERLSYLSKFYPVWKNRRAEDRKNLFRTGAKAPRDPVKPLEEEYSKNADVTLSFRFAGSYIVARKRLGSQGEWADEGS